MIEKRLETVAFAEGFLKILESEEKDEFLYTRYILFFNLACSDALSQTYDVIAVCVCVYL